jgi:hypothetical protein
MNKEIKKLKKAILAMEEVTSVVLKEGYEITSIKELGLILWIDRTFAGLKSAEVILDKLHFEPMLDHSLGLIFRSIITDFFLVMNILGHAKSKDDVEPILIHYFKDGEKKMDSFINTLERTGRYPEDMVSQIRKNLKDVSNFRGLIREDYLLKIEVPILTTKIFESLASNPLILEQKIFSLVLHAFDLWKFYCQYEHYSLSYYEFTRKPKGPIFNSRIISIIDISFVIFGFCLKNLGREDLEEKITSFHAAELNRISN